MPLDAEPSELLDSPHHAVNGPTPLQPDRRVKIENSNRLNDLDPIQLDIPGADPAITEEEPFEMNCSLDPLENFVGAEYYLENYPGVLNDCLMSESSDWQQPPQSPHSTRMYYSQGNTQDDVPSTGTEDPHREEHVRRQFNPYPSPPSNSEKTGVGRKHDESGRLIKNSMAASRCRKKKKREEEILTSRAKELEADHNALKHRVEGLRLEVLDLKNELLNHAGCDCELIQTYITEAARRIS